MSYMSYGLLKGKNLVVTGASRGIGRSVAIAAARNGANVLIHHLGNSTRDDANQVATSCRGLGAKVVLVEGDISAPDTADKIVSAALEAFTRIDCLVSNAGICQFHPFLTLPHELWRQHHAVNLDGAFYVVQAVANAMAQQQPDASGLERGSIVGISSISAVMGGGEQCHYTPTKAAVKSLMESCAIALGPLGIRCNSIMPGTIVTDMNREHLENDSAARADQERRVPLGRLGDPDEVADATIFLCSPLARYVNGVGLLVDGGMKISLQ